MKILVSAFAFSPNAGSERGVGWNICNELAKYNDVTVVFGDVRGDRRSLKAVSEYCGSTGPEFKIGNLRAIYIPPSRVIRLIERMHYLPGCVMLYYLAYNLWQRRAYRHVKHMCQFEKFDIVHHLGMTGYREPGYMWRLGIPFVWGPVGGSPDEPVSFLPVYPISAWPNVIVRNLVNWMQKRILWRPRRAARAARKIWGITAADLYTIRNIWGRECEQLAESSAVCDPHARVHEWDGTGPLRLSWSGIHAYGKALPILMYAIAEIGKRKGKFSCHVDVLGAGAQTKNWQKLAIRLGIDKMFKWHGFLPIDQAKDMVRSSHVFVFTSVKEGTPHVVLEALAMGVPVICHNACGMGMAVNDDCGIRVPITSVKESVEGFANALMAFHNTPHLVKRLSAGAIKRAGQLTAGEKGCKISSAYDQVHREYKRQKDRKESNVQG